MQFTAVAELGENNRRKSVRLIPVKKDSEKLVITDIRLESEDPEDLKGFEPGKDYEVVIGIATELDPEDKKTDPDPDPEE
jgi:hypothetical protein